MEKYAIVRWRDAVGVTGKTIKPNRITANLAVCESMGWIFTDVEGTLAVIHDRVISKGEEKRTQLTIIPKSWILEEKKLIQKQKKESQSKSDQKSLDTS